MATTKGKTSRVGDPVQCSPQCDYGWGPRVYPVWQWMVAQSSPSLWWGSQGMMVHWVTLNPCYPQLVLHGHTSRITLLSPLLWKSCSLQGYPQRFTYKQENPLKNLFWFLVKPFPQRVLHGIQKSSTWNQKGFNLEPKIVLLWGQPNNRFGTIFSKSVSITHIAHFHWGFNPVFYPNALIFLLPSMWPGTSVSLGHGSGGVRAKAKTWGRLRLQLHNNG